MKLYKLFEEVILEKIGEGQLINESVSTDEIRKAIEGRKAVNILYRDSEKLPPSKRYVLVTVYGQLHNGNFAVRAQQISGGSKRGNNNAATKIFRVDRIDGWYPTNMTINAPVDNYNPDGDQKFDLKTRTVQDTFSKIIYQAVPYVKPQPKVQPQAEPQVNPEMGETNNDLMK